MSSEQEIIPNFIFNESNDFDIKKITKIDLLPDSQCFVLNNVLTKLECDQLIEQGEKFGFRELAGSYTYTYRTNKRVINFNEQLKQILWKRIDNYVDTFIEIKGKHPTILTTYFTDGIWQKDDLNTNFRLCKYNPTNFFKKHVDEGYHPVTKNHRSLKTCMVYLNSDFEGGETVFYFNEKYSYSLKADLGTCLIFNQNILHEGMPVLSGLKYFIRTDILYKKIASTQNETLTPEQHEALELYDQAIELEKDDKHSEAIEMYKKANKIYLNVDFLYNSLFG